MYIAAVPPGESVHGFFNDHVKGFHMALLIDNPCAIVGDQTNALFDTRSPGMTAEKIAKYAKVEKFEKLILYSANARGKNVLLKYKNGGIVAPRNGNAISRIGVFQRFQGRRVTSNMLDFDTNISSINAYKVISGASKRKS